MLMLLLLMLLLLLVLISRTKAIHPIHRAPPDDTLQGTCFWENVVAFIRNVIVH